MQYAVWFYGTDDDVRRFFNAYPDLTLAMESAERLLKIDWVVATVIGRQAGQERTAMEQADDEAFTRGRSVGYRLGYEDGYEQGFFRGFQEAVARGEAAKRGVPGHEKGEQ